MDFSFLHLITLPFFQRALIVGLLVGTLMAILGVFVVLRKMSFFSDAIGHTALTGIALGLLFGFNPFLGALGFAILVALLIAGIRATSNISIDAVLGVVFAAAVSLGVILLTFTSGYQTDLISFLFGNILTVSNYDIIASITMLCIAGITLLLTGKQLTLITLNPELATTQGIPVKKYELIFLILLASTIALGIKFVGIILVTVLIVTPAASAQNIATSMKQMIVISLALSIISIFVGMGSSLILNTPPGPTIVLSSTILFFITLIIRIGKK